ncbi:MAG: hypothetical protein JSS78_03095 [Bacteroidetes bacterium]|nr:hypothetical protein [Bacteroidota bacterium]
MSPRIEKIIAMLQQSPTDCFLHHALALEYVKLGLDKDARQHFDSNLKNDSDYLATYYHLGKLMERAGEIEQALAMYESGMKVAQKVKDNHTYNELQAAYDDLAY